MWQLSTLQCGVDECSRVVIGGSRSRGEGHTASPTFWSFRMNSGQDYPSLATRSFDDRRCSVGILSDNVPRTCKLRTVFPVMFDYWRVDAGDWYRRLVDTSIHHRVKLKIHTRC